MKCRASALSRITSHSRGVGLTAVSAGQGWMRHWTITMSRPWKMTFPESNRTMNKVMVLLLITWSKSPVRVACSCRRWHRRRTRKRWNACGKRRSAGKEGVCKSKYGKKCRKRQTKIASVHCTLGGKWTLKFHLLQSVSKWIFMFAKEQQGIFSFTRNDSSNSKYLALAGN